MASPAKDHDRTALIILGLITIGALGSSSYLYLHQGDLEEQATHERIAKDKALSEQRTAQEQLRATSLLLGAANASNMEAHANIGALEARLKETDARAEALARTAGRNSAQARELAELRNAASELRDELERALDTEGQLRASIDRVNSERDALARRMELREVGALMVNNAEVDALMGRKQKLTVKARRTKEVHLAFDLPSELASGANYRVIAPNGKEYTGADPVISTASIPADATASAGLSGKPTRAIRTERVDLKFRTSDRLQPGTYRIEVRSGNDELQTIHLNLR